MTEAGVVDLRMDLIFPGILVVGPSFLNIFSDEFDFQQIENLITAIVESDEVGLVHTLSLHRLVFFSFFKK